MSDRWPWYVRVLVGQPARVRTHLARMQARGA